MAQAKTLTKKELKLVIDIASASGIHSSRNRTMLLLTHLCGMRIGEVVSLKVGDVIDESGNVRDQFHLTAEQTKGNKSRVVFAGKKIQRELKSYVKSIEVKSFNQPLFVSQKRKAFSSNTGTQLMRNLYAKAGIKGATSHTGRRTFITDLAAKGVGVRVLQALAGHSSISVTQRYIDVNDDMMRNAVELVS